MDVQSCSSSTGDWKELTTLGRNWIQKYLDGKMKMLVNLLNREPLNCGISYWTYWVRGEGRSRQPQTQRLVLDLLTIKRATSVGPTEFEDIHLPQTFLLWSYCVKSCQILLSLGSARRLSLQIWAGKFDEFLGLPSISFSSSNIRHGNTATWQAILSFRPPQSVFLSELLSLDFHCARRESRLGLRIFRWFLAICLKSRVYSINTYQDWPIPFVGQPCVCMSVYVHNCCTCIFIHVYICIDIRMYLCNTFVLI